LKGGKLLVKLKNATNNQLIVDVNNEELLVTFDNNFNIRRIDGGGRRTLTPAINKEIQLLVYRQA
jgi:hypothetical protein